MPSYLTPAVLWICSGLILFIIEIIAPGFVIACFGIGCFVAALTQVADLNITWQLGGFCAGSVLSLFLLRPVVLKYLHKSPEEIATNCSAVVGQIGIVTTPFDNVMFEGRVKVGGDDWKAKSLDNVPFEAGTRVSVVQVEGVTIFVRGA